MLRAMVKALDVWFGVEDVDFHNNYQKITHLHFLVLTDLEYQELVPSAEVID